MSFGTRIEPRYEPREILLAIVKFHDQEEPEIRPVLVLSKFSLTPANEIFICLAISSSLEQNNPFRIDIMGNDTEEGSFPKPSQVVCDNFFTIPKTDVQKRIGKVTIQFYSKITR
ncbi:MAG: type II toxin-antitoxin system PemK/MazF family toxin, partial [Nitrosarchaeum sp.]